MDHHSGPFSIPAIRSFIPEKVKPWIVIVFVIVFQLSGGIYLAVVSEMVGSLALMQEDIMMAGYASLVGLALTFTIMFRLKFRFASKTSLLTCAGALIVCNFICMHTRSVPVLVVVCFFAGIFRMWGTFECNSTIQLWLTPKRDLSVFFCFINVLVQGSIQLSGLLTVYIAFLSKWEYAHWLIIGLLAIVMLATVIIYRPNRIMRKLPLLGIDWLGAVLWAGVVLCIIFICNYGDHYDWFASPYIRVAAVGAITMLGLNLWRASFIRHPFINNVTWTFRPVYTTLLLYLVIDILLAPSHLFEHIYTEAILGYDALHVSSLNWILLLGTIAGSLFSYYTFAKRKWRYKTMTFIGFMAIIAYLMLFYFTLDYNLPKSSLYLPLFLRGFGYVVIAICFLTILSRVPFQYFFQSLSIQAFVSACIGGVLGTAILKEFLKRFMQSNALTLSSGIDQLNPLLAHIPAGEVYGAVQQQALMLSMKELYGWLVLLAIFCLLIYLIRESDIRPRHAIHPTYKAIRKLIVKLDFN